MLKVLIVDDSVVFRTQISKALTGVEGIEVVGSAINGSIALQKLEQISIDVVTLDLEMPDMDGIQVLRKIIEKKFKVKVIVFSSQTTRGAEKALEALREGADDVVAKPKIEAGSAKAPHEIIRETLAPKILQFDPGGINNLKIDNSSGLNSSSSSSISENHNKASQNPQTNEFNVKNFSPFNFNNSFTQVLIIASSTGGPNALETLFKNIKKANVPVRTTPTQRSPYIFAADSNK